MVIELRDISCKKNKKERFLIVASNPDSLLNFRIDLIDALADFGVEVHVASPDLEKATLTHNALLKRGVKCHEFPLSRTGLNPFDDIRSFLYLYKLMKQIRPNFFLGYTIKPVIWGLKAAKAARVKTRMALITGLGYAFTGSAMGLRGRIQKIALLLYKWSLRDASLVFFQNSDDYNEFASKGMLNKSSSVEIVNGSGVNCERFCESNLPDKTTTNYLLIARLLGDKGVREYISAARAIAKNYSHARFHIVGGLDTNPEGISEDEVNSWVREGVVNWHGAVTDVRPFISDCHVYVLPSYREGTPRSVLEAMSMGRAVITTNAPGCRETVIQGENGFLVDVQSVEQLVTAMERFIQQPELIESMGKRSREIACEKYDVHKVNHAMLNAMGIIR